MLVRRTHRARPQRFRLLVRQTGKGFATGLPLKVLAHETMEAAMTSMSADDPPERPRPWMTRTVIAAIVLLAGSLAFAAGTLVPSTIADALGFGSTSPSASPVAGAADDEHRDDAASPDPDDAGHSPEDVEAAPLDRSAAPDPGPTASSAPTNDGDTNDGDRDGSRTNDGDTNDSEDEAEDAADTAELGQDEPAETRAASDGPEPSEDPALELVEVQERLRDHRFLIGSADGQAGQQTTAAVMAYQRVNGLAVDGVIGPATTAALLSGSAEPTLAGGADNRIEVDLDAQLLHVVEDGRRTVTLQVSSGNGETYTNANGSARARTPVGSFSIERRIPGLREAALGTLYDPLYFYRGFAVHGSPSVPAYPASHGCVRITRADATWLIERAPDGMPVDLYGGTHVFAL